VKKSKTVSCSSNKMKKGGMVSKKKPLPKAVLGAMIAAPAALIGGNMLQKKLQKKIKNDLPMVSTLMGVPGAGAAAGAAGGMGGLGSMLGGVPGMKKGGTVKKKTGKKK
jgi:hypothetical protein